MSYRHNDILYKHKVRANRLKKSAFVITGIASIFVLVVAVDWVLGQLSNSNTVVSKENLTSVQSVNVSVYRTEFFQFQASEAWIAVAGETTNDKYVYVKNNGNLITQKFTVYVNRPEKSKEADLKITNVLPVEMGSLGNFINIGEISKHCSEVWPANSPRDPSRVEQNFVSFVCSPDSEQYNVVVGEYNDDEDISSTLSNGEAVSYTIIYSDLTAYPGAGEMYNIITSFSAL